LSIVNRAQIEDLGSNSHYNETVKQPIKRQDVSWFNRFLNNTPETSDVPSPSTGFFDIEGQPVPLSVAQQDVRAARELIRNAAVRTTQLHGIPSNWLSYEVVTIADEEKAYFQLQVSMRIWDELLWSQTSAYEQQVLKQIRQEDVNVARAVRAVLWRILPDAGCPQDELSGQATWQPDAVKERSAAYDRLRGELAASADSMPSAIASAGGAFATLPLEPALDANLDTAAPAAGSDFGDTLSVANPGFDETRPVIFDNEKVP
jgi:hypothetical protein